MARNTSHLTADFRRRISVRSIRRMLPALMVALMGTLAWAPTPSFSFQSTLPAGFVETLVADGLTQPTAMAIAPDGRLFVCLQGGQLRVIKNDALLPTPFLSLAVPQDGERGLLGVAFDPNFATNQYIYVYYTRQSTPIRHRVSRFTANGDVAAPGSETAIFDLDDTSGSAYHNGGALHFGPDGKLYIAAGDNSIPPAAQSLANLYGKILRINADGTIPTDNPFYAQATGNNRAIWALGFRNPFTFTFQPGTGRMFINDVGSSSREEINDGLAGENYGWPHCEGPCSPAKPYRDPVHSYPRVGGSGGDCAITGGAFYNPTTIQFPSEYYGSYFFADYCGRKIRRYNPATGSVTLFATVYWPVNMLVSPDGSLYYFSFWDSELYRIRYTANLPPQIATHPASRTIPAGQPVTFTVNASGTQPLSYQWQRNGANIAGAASASYTIASAIFSDNAATFRCTVTNAFGSATSNEATLTVTGNQPPTAAITTPVAGTLYRGGQTLAYAGTGTDPETGDLPPSAFTWRVDFHHDDHLHPFVPSTSGVAGGSAVIPTVGETAVNVWYRIHLTVTDPQGQSHSVYRDISPEISTIALQTGPAGLQLTLDGSPIATPASLQSVVGINRELGVVSPQTLGGADYVFASWSDSGAETHSIATPATNTTYTATFVACNQTITPTSQTIAAAGGTGTVSVTSPTGCAWTATSNKAWITITGGSAGTTNGSVSFSVAANSGAERTGTIAIAGQTYSVTQSSGCTYSISPASQTITAAGGTGITSVTTGTGCAWTAVSNDAWITVTAGATGSGNGNVNFSIAGNGGAERTGTITIAGQTFTVTQSLACNYAIAPASQTIATAGGAGTASVTAAAGCAWTAISNDTWITVTAGASGSGDGTVSFSVAANSGAERTGTIAIAGQTYSVTQSSGCTYSISPASQTITAAGGTGITSVTTGTGCAWTAVSNDAWITVTAGATGSGNGNVNFSIAGNGGAERTGTITIAGQTFTVTQSLACNYAIAPASQTIAAAGGTGSTNVTAGAGCAWTAVSNAAWITVTAGASGSGNGAVSFSVAANSGLERTGTITIAGQTFNVTQSAGCTYSISPASQTIAAAGGTGSTNVTAGTGCAWTAVSNAAWITVTAGASGSGNGAVSFSVAANSGLERTGTITIAGQTFSVTQSAGCTYSISPASQTIAAAGGTGSTSVTAGTGCAWTAVSNAAWITVTAGASGSGNGAVSFSVAANSGPERTGTITIAGQTFSVTQSAGCTYSISPASQTIAAAGGTGSTNVTAGAGCAWTAVSNAAWITVTAGAGGSGDGTVSFSVAANSGPERTGTITIAGQTFSVTQSAGCTYSISPASQTIAAAGGTGSTNVTAGAGCAWTAVSNAAWITVTAGAGGSGDGTVSFLVAANSGPERTGTITIAGQTFSVTQSAGCTYSISPASQTIAAAGGTGSTTVTAGAGCAWTAVSNAAWITVTAGAGGSGDGTVSFLVAANSGPERTGTITIAGQTFSVTQSAGCTYSISPASQTIAAAGGTGSTSVTAGTGCAWTAVSNAAWITVTAGASGSGNGAVSFSVAANSGPERTGTITIAGQTFSVTQSAGCTYSISPASQTIAAAGGTGSTNVTAGAGCAWTAVSNAAWITVTAGAGGSGDGTVSFLVAANSGPERTGTITIAGQTFSVTQSAGCTYSISPASQTIAAAGGTGTTNVTAGAGCAWTAVSNAAWITVTAGASGSGDGAVSFSVAANSGPERTGTITIAGQTFSVTQSAGCTYSISPASQTIAAAGGTGSTNVTAGAGCAWTAVSNAAWITVTAGASGSGDGAVSFSVAANSGPERTGTITIAGQTFSVTQSAGCTYSISPASQTIAAAGGTGSTNVTAGAGCAWTAVSNAAWITVTAGASGSGNGAVSFSVAANSGPERTGTITIAGQTFSVTQSAGCTYSISPASQTIAAAGGTGSTNVTAGAGCAWTAVSNAAWITVTAGAGGSGDGTVSFLVAANSGPERTGTITIAGQTFSVTQSAGCTYSISPASQTIAAAGGTGSTTVTAGAGCAWTAVSNAAWITVTAGAGGSGDGTVSFSVAANSGPERTGTITIAGQTFSVTQSAGCTYSISPASQTIAAAGGTGTTNVTAGAGCAWTAVSNAAWITVTAGASGSGNGAVSFSVAANSGPERTGTITIAGQTFSVTQSAGCTYSISPASQTIAAAGGTGSTTVTAGAGCAWTAVSNAAWITVTAGAGGSGDGTVSFLVAANSGPERTGTITIAGQTFSVTQSAGCTYSISPASQTIAAAGGTGSTSVTAGTGCAWTAVSNAAWITVTAGASGSGNGAVSFSVAANSGPERTGTITIAGQTFSVTQSAGCTYSISPASLTIAAAGGTGSTNVTAGAGCAWTAVSNAAWITITAGASGSGNGAVSFSVAANTSAARTGTITIAGQTFSVTQSAGCTYSISPASQTIAAAGGTGSTNVTAGAGCAWTAVSNAAWITVTAGASGSGNGAVSFSVAANTGPGRSGTITIAGQTFTVTQSSGTSCTYSISPTSRTISSAARTGNVSVTAAAGCAWTATSNAAWITVTAGAGGSGNGTVSYSVPANTGPQRVGTITIAGQTFTLTQNSGCTYSLSPTSQTVAAAGGTGAVSVTTAAGCTWTATSNRTWITFPGTTTGSGNGSLSYTVAANVGPVRSGTITIGGQTLTITQSAGCTYSFDPPSRIIASAGGTGSVSVTASAGSCAWTATSNAAWITVTAGASGTGNGSVSYSVAANTGSERTGTIAIGVQTFSITQSSACASIGANQTIASPGGAGTVSVTASSGCAWTATSNAPWITITAGAGGSGNGGVGFSAAANSTGAVRVGTITIAGHTFTLTQGAGCAAISPASLSFPSAGGAGTVTVTAPAGCAWTAASNNTGWITVTAGASGNGNGTVTFTVKARTGGPRTGTITIAGYSFTVTQSGS